MLKISSCVLTNRIFYPTNEILKPKDRIKFLMASNLQGTQQLEGNIRQYPNNVTLTEYFQQGFSCGGINPDHVALVDGEKTHTFKQLDDISNKLASKIWQTIRNAENKNPDGDTVIGVCIQPSDTLITTLFSILKSGAAFVPFEPSFPEERIVKIVNNCKPLMIICDGRSNIIGKFESVKKYTKIITTDVFFNVNHLQDVHSVTSCNANVVSEDTAIILYTSGSSGEPKGVRLSHNAVMNRLNWQWEQFPFIPTEKCVFKTSLTFVDSVAEIFAPLLQGYPLIVLDKTITSQTPLFMEKLHSYGITRVVVVPSLLKAIFQTCSIIGKSKGQSLLRSVRLWVCSGEALSYDLLAEFFTVLPQNFTLCNFYGSTEVMGDVTYVSYTSIQDVEANTLEKRVPIGFPVYNTSIYILTESLNHVENGKIGEIYVGGSNLAKGYVGINDSDKFITNPYSKLSEHNKLYKTGDFGRIANLSNGRNILMYEGRIDSQIKVRGQRVDLSEVEIVISEFDIVSKVKVLCYHPGQVDQIVLAYVVLHKPVSNENVMQYMEKSLREYERPILRFLEDIPLLVNGKTDRQRLLKMFEVEIEQRDEFEEWSTLNITEDKIDMVKTVFKIISEVTGSSIQTIADNFDDSFFNIGGTSLNTVIVIVKLKEHNLYISIPEFTSAFTIRDIIMKISTVENDEFSSHTSKPLTIPYNEEYNVSLLTEADKDEVIHIISYSFAKKGDLEAYVNVAYNEFADLIRSIWKDIVEKQLSFIVRRKPSGKAISVSLNFDAYDEPIEADCSQGIKYVMEFLESVESEQREKLPKGKGELFHSFMMGTPEDVDDAERVLLIEFMEEQNVVLARKKNFVGILTTNTNPLTMQIGRDIHRYEILCEYQVNEYVAPDGSKPFGLAKNEFTIICCWKQLS